MSIELLWLMVAAGLITYASRVLPFVLLKQTDQPFLRHAGRQMPAMILTLLVLYSLADVNLLPGQWQQAQGLPLLIPALLAWVLHWRWRNVLLSILAATGCHMLLLQWAG
ncbi:branched-chain amino acid transporter permease [Isoalcanivorax beigongshangi]|uniref:Branched-chain amino acid transporter permease n=1 Tax=Isoalcanivorax beigongshangi TaxID=3238810 RepID=A0ABV4AFS7_9GAMM